MTRPHLPASRMRMRSASITVCSRCAIVNTCNTDRERIVLQSVETDSKMFGVFANGGLNELVCGIVAVGSGFV